MINLEFNPSIATKITYTIPILFGVPKYAKKELFSYSIYENNKINEVRFKTKEVLKYYFQNYFLNSVEVFDENNKVRLTKFELIERNDSKILFRDWTPKNGDGNHGTLQKHECGTRQTLQFHRVDSFLGYNIRGAFRCTSNLIEEEHYSQWSTTNRNFDLQTILLNEYTLKENKLDVLARSILENGWLS